MPEQLDSATATQGPLSADMLARMDAYWRAANYLSVGQIYLKDNPLLRRPLTLDDVKPRLLGHWGTTPGLNFLYVHWNRLIRERGLKMLYIIAPAMAVPASWPTPISKVPTPRCIRISSRTPTASSASSASSVGRMESQAMWLQRLPAPSTRAANSATPRPRLRRGLRQSDLLVACVVGDGEAETGPLATSWHSNKFLNPATDGAVLPILHLNGYKIANPTVLSRIPHAEIESLMRGYGYEPFTLQGNDPAVMHQQAAAVFDTMLDRIAAIQKAAREAMAKGETIERPAWPMLIMRTPKGWTGPKFVDGKPVENTWRPIRFRCPSFSKSRITWPCSMRGCTATNPKSFSTRRVTCAPISLKLHPRATCAWA